MTSAGKITLYYDAVSPFAFFGLHTLELLRQIWPVSVDYVPVSINIVMKESGNRPPISVVAKGTHMNTDISRVVDILGLGKFGRPSTFPFNSFKAQRVLTAAKRDLKRDDFVNCCRAMSRAAWTEDKDLTDDAVIVATLATVIPDWQAKEFLTSGAKDTTVKEELVRNTKEIIDQGSFGLPWWKVENAKTGKVDYFWGHDRYEYIAHALDLEWPGFKAVARKQAAKL